MQSAFAHDIQTHCVKLKIFNHIVEGMFKSTRYYPEHCSTHSASILTTGKLCPVSTGCLLVSAYIILVLLNMFCKMFDVIGLHNHNNFPTQ